MFTTRHRIYAAAVTAALGLTVSYVAAQNRPDAGSACCDKAPGASQEARCPMHALRELADVQQESNDLGAELQFSAKDRSKVTEVQNLVGKLAAHIKSATGCRMHGDAAPLGHEHKAKH